MAGPLTSGELARLREEFMISFIYNSNAIEGNTLTLQETALVLEGITITQKPLKVGAWGRIKNKAIKSVIISAPRPDYYRRRYWSI